MSQFDRTLSSSLINEFPLLHEKFKDQNIVFLDNAASTQKPRCVIERLHQYYTTENANVHRGTHFLTQKATDAFEGAREKIQKYINAAHAHECIFVKGTTEAINLVANGFKSQNLTSEDEVIVSIMEHHSNIVPWQIACMATGANLKVIACDLNGNLNVSELNTLISPKTKLIALTHVSNALGTVNPIKKIIAMAHSKGIPVLVDGAQAVSHMAIDVQDLDCDFYAFSSHKLYGPTGIGVLYGKTKQLEALVPYQLGGEMIKNVSFEKTTFNDLPFKFEAGTPPIAQAIGLGQAIDFVQSVGLDVLGPLEDAIITYGMDQLKKVPGLRFIGEPEHRAGVISFLLEDFIPMDVGQLLSERGVCLRTGRHCAEPLMAHFNIKSTLRASVALYNTPEDFEQLAQHLIEIQKTLKGAKKS